MTLVVLLAFAVSQMLTIPLHGLWVVLTAVVVTQMSAGGSLRATGEYMIGTLSGVVYAGALGVLIPHTTAIEEGGLLALTIAPLALMAAIKPSFRVAPFTAVLVLLISGQLGQGPIESALNRLLEVALGGMIAMAVSLLVLPQRAYSLALEAATRILVRMAVFLPELLEGFSRSLDPVEVGRSAGRNRPRRHRVPGDRGGGEKRADGQAGGGARRGTAVADAAAAAPRSRHPRACRGRSASRTFLRSGCARSSPRSRPRRANFFVAARRRSPAVAVRRRSMRWMRRSQAYVSEVVAMRREGLTRALSIEEAERVFTLAFALEQLYRNFSDLDRCVKEHADALCGKAAGVGTSARMRSTVALRV